MIEELASRKEPNVAVRGIADSPFQVVRLRLDQHVLYPPHLQQQSLHVVVFRFENEQLCMGRVVHLYAELAHIGIKVLSLAASL